jgi:hypothetical protein
MPTNDTATARRRRMAPDGPILRHPQRNVKFSAATLRSDAKRRRKRS